MKTAVIVPTYNSPDALNVVLHGYSLQDDLNFDMIMADGRLESYADIMYDIAFGHAGLD